MNKNTDKIKLSDYLLAFRADRPSEWQMDSFIQRAKELEAIAHTNNTQSDDVKQALEKAAQIANQEVMTSWNAETDAHNKCAKNIRDSIRALIDQADAPVSEKG